MFGMLRRRKKLARGAGRRGTDPAIRAMVEKLDRYSRARDGVSVRPKRGRSRRAERRFVAFAATVTLAALLGFVAGQVAYAYFLPADLIAVYQGR